MNKSERLSSIKNKIDEACRKSGRAPESVKLIGVSKTKSWQELVEFLPLGLRDFGENYPQEAVKKMEEVAAWNRQFPAADAPIWHFIGRLQSNKARLIAGKFEWIHALDSIAGAQKLSTHSLGLNKKQKCLLQVNVDLEKTKGGILPENIISFVEELNPLEGIQVCGLMCIPKPDPLRDPRIPFSQTRELMESINSAGCYNTELVELSMGMSGDFEYAIEEGSTFVRIGTALFGERNV